MSSTMIFLRDSTMCLFLAISLFSMGTTHALLRGNETDHEALLGFKRSIKQDPQGALSSWNESFHVCRWEGVTCGRKHQRVTRISFNSKGLEGPLSPYVGNLSFLRVLNVGDNSFTGEIPSQIGQLLRLQVHNVSHNHFEGEIPPNISQCLNLVAIGVYGNNLMGKFPKELGLLSKLKRLLVHRNSFSGGLQHFLGNLTSLESLSALENQLEGTIPHSIGLLENLTFLGLGYNNFQGIVPPSFYNLSMLTIISFDQNQFQGSLPPNIGFMLPRLQILQLSENQFSGSLPLSLSNCSDLDALQLNNNNFEGKIGVDFGRIISLRVIILHFNNFGSGENDEMNFIGYATNCSKLETLELNFNKLKGSLPNSVGNLSTKLTYLGLQDNQIHGRLPSSIGALVNLSLLDVYGNQFTGNIPASIGNMKNLNEAYLDNNKFSGEIPISVGNLSSLIKLYLRMNRLEGMIPPSLGNCTSLLELDLSQNKLSGFIPKQLFRLSALSISLNISMNHLYGPLPPDVSNLEILGKLDLSNNNLSGEIPTGLGGCRSIEDLFLHNNMFQGSIPSSLSALKGVINLDFSRNNFSGRIPKYFEVLSMKYLNLSFNNFEGEVPMGGVFANNSAVFLDGNNKLCGGRSILHLPKCPSKQLKKRHQTSHALIIVISCICTVLLLTLISCFLLRQRKVAKKVKSSGREMLMKEPFLRVSYDMLLKATDGFSIQNLVGRGSFGSVYKGIMEEVVVAVKVLNLQSREASKSFMIECEALRNARHRNLVKIITCCATIDFHGNDFKALVYEFMSNGSLDSWLSSNQEAHEGDELQRLSFAQRVNIAIDVACALDYLHNQSENCIIHCDLKPSNILLDGDMIAHVGDFGIAKLLVPELKSLEATQSSSIGVKGTIGYAAPEYAMGNEVSRMGDVYSYGILLLEMMMGKKPTDPMFEGDLNLHNFAKMSLNGDRVMKFLDPILVNTTFEEEVASLTNDNQEIHENALVECLISTIKIGIGCSVELAQDRMHITNVLVELHSIRRVLEGTPYGT